MLGVVLIYVGVVLILNGIGRLCNIDAKSTEKRADLVLVFVIFLVYGAVDNSVCLPLYGECEICKQQWLSRTPEGRKFSLSSTKSFVIRVSSMPLGR